MNFMILVSALGFILLQCKAILVMCLEVSFKYGDNQTPTIRIPSEEVNENNWCLYL